MARPTLISTPEELDGAFELSHERPVLILKHSLACGASAAAHEVYHEFVESRLDDEQVDYAVLLIQRSRDLSDELARRTGIRHQSPQVVLLRHGRAAWSASHWGISRENLQQAVDIVPA
jgi:bacillithiol system protein YtxJ